MIELLDEDGENQAVRCFLMAYGGRKSLCIGDMRQHMQASGYSYWPKWVEEADKLEHLTKGGAQSWLRYLFSLENISS